MAQLDQILAVGFSALLRSRRKSLPHWSVVAIAVVLLVMALGFGAFSAYLALADHVGPPAAAAIIAASLLLASVLSIAVPWLYRLSARRHADSELTPDELAKVVVKLNAIIGEALPESKSSLTAIAVVAGLAAGYSPALRRFLRNL